MKNNNKKYSLKYINKPILILTLLLAGVGAFLILDASSISAQLTYGYDTPYYFFNKQLIFIAISLVGSFIVIKYPTSLYKGTSLILSVIFILALFIVYLKNSLFSSSVSVVTLSMFGGRFQPAEFLKVFLIMYMGAFYGSWVNKKDRGRWTFIIPLTLCAFSAILILLGGDFGSAAIMVALYALVFMCIPTSDKIVKNIKLVAVVGLVSAVLILKFAYAIIPEHVLQSDYRLNRFIYTNPCDRYEEDSGYQVCNGFIAMDNGGLTGVGIGNSVQKYLYLPASHTDFIFPIVVEEFGVLSGVVIIGLYMLLLFYIFRVALKCNKLQNSIICYGIGIYIMLHIFVNLGGVLGVIPLTGVPLPFLSYGGSFCITVICSLAIVQRIHIENEIDRRTKLAASS